MTEKLFYIDPYICEAECEVKEIIEKDGNYEVVLKSTPFYPEGGGQPSDIGYIDNIKVSYVYEEDEVIYHVVGKRPANDVVKCKVNLDRRIDLTQQHSGEHLLSAAFFKLYNAKNAGFHLGDDYATADIEIRDMTEEMIKNVETEVNLNIFKNELVKTYFLTKDEALKLPLRKEIKAKGIIRIVQIGENTDFSACCGTQVKRTGEIGVVKVIKYEKNKGMTRVYFKCGFRALKDYQIKHDDVIEISRSFSIEPSEVVSKVKALKDEIVELKKKITSLYQNLAAKEAKRLLENVNSKFILAEYEDETFEFLERVYDELKEKEVILILVSLKENRLILAQNGNFSFQCGKLFKDKLKEFGGRGGGSDTRAQASFEDCEQLKRFIEYLKENL